MKKNDYDFDTAKFEIFREKVFDLDLKLFKFK